MIPILKAVVLRLEHPNKTAVLKLSFQAAVFLFKNRITGGCEAAFF